MSLIYFLPIFIIIIFIIIWFFYDTRGVKKQIIQLSKLDPTYIIGQQKETNKEEKDNINLKLIQAGLTKKEYYEGRMLLGIVGLIIGGFSLIYFSQTFAFLGFILGILLAIFSGKLYIYISKKEREEKINNDLGVFLDLINVILEAGGGLKNAFFTVSTRAHGIVDEELLKEIAILEYEMSNYSTKKAYENLKKRVDSEDIAKIVDFLILSEEAGIGVKNIFSAQSDEMRQEKFYKIKGKVNTLNMYLMLVIFVFVMPTLGAFIVFPMMAGKLDFGM
ncbi:type II secretion system F family protein [Campylobacterota bacterium DY0563]